MKQKKTVDKSKIKAVSEADHDSVIELLKGRCMELSFTIHGLPKTRVVRGKMAQAIAGSVKGTTKGIRGSWSTFTSEHPSVAEFNASVRELTKLRDSWTIVRSAEAKKGEGGNVSIEGGVRLIWDHDIDEFHKLFIMRAKAIDSAVEKIHKYLDETLVVTDPDTGEETSYESIKEIDRKNAGECWDESVYPKDVRLVAGVARDRDKSGAEVLDEKGNPKYLVNYEEYHVSEKLSDLLRKRAIERIDQQMNETVETAFNYAMSELTGDLQTFMAELVNRIRIYPKGGKYAKYCEIEKAEVIKVVDNTKDSSVPSGMVKVRLAYKTPDENTEKNVTTFAWIGPISINEYQTEMRPQATGEKKKIYAGVIEGILAKMEAFRDKQGKMLGVYGENALAGFESLWQELTKYKTFHTTNEQAAQKLVSKLKSSTEAKEEIGALIADTIDILADQTEGIKETVRRRKISSKLIGKVGDDDDE